MPVKRNTRKVSVKPKKAVKKGTDDEENEWKDKICREFLVDVAAAKANIRKQRRSTVVEFKKFLNASLALIPKELRHLTLKEFAELGGTFSAASTANVDKKKEDITDMLKAEILAGGSSEEDEEEVGDLKTVQTALQKKKQVQRSKRTPASASLRGRKAASASIEERGEAEEKLGDLKTVQTAVQGKRRMLRRMKTPAITPKFDPGATISPDNIRNQLPGERIVIMSMTGTPVRSIIPKEPITATLKDYGLSPNKIGEILGTLSTSINIR